MPDDEYLDDCEDSENDDDCDCVNDAFDILTGEVRCLRCRRARYVNGEEFQRRVQFEVEAYEAFLEATEKSNQQEEPTS